MSFTRVINLFLIIAVVLVMRVSANWSSQEPQTRKHTVRPGETLSIIAQNYGFERQELIEYNKIDNPARLEVGQIIYFPGDIQLPQVSDTGSMPAQPVAPLNATQFPPASAKPSPEEYYQLQQYMTHQDGAPPASDVDYNYILKPPVEAQPALHKSLIPPDKDKEQPEAQPDTEEKVAEKKEEPKKEEIPDDASPALAAFGDRPYAYFAGGESLVDVIQNFAGSYYIPTVIAEDVVGEVNGKIGPLTPVDFLDHMANIYGFIWYFDGHTLFVYNGNAATQKIISLSYMTVDQFKSTLKTVGIWDGRFFWKAQPKEGLVFISGPPRYIELVSQTALLLDDKEGERQKSKLTVKTFKLKYAWATDKSFALRGQQVTVPGVATILRSIVSGGGVAQINKTTLPSPTLKAAKGVIESKAAKPTSEGQQLNEGVDAESVYINADPRINAIIVHDLEAKMPMYEELIQSLDKPTSQIEIQVSIIDVNTSTLDDLGIEWSYDSDKISFNTGSSAYSTIVEASAGSFNAKIKVLSDEGKAKVVSRPSILTLDNLEAVLDNSSTFYVPVEGREDSELFPVTSGTVVQVTPRIVREDQGRRIHMSINIQDGSEDQEGQEYATTTNSSISTQAIVNEKESLLVGGFYKLTETDDLSKIPVLADIPVVGALFKSERKLKNKQVRLFLITPRIVGIERS